MTASLMPRPEPREVVLIAIGVAGAAAVVVGLAGPLVGLALIAGIVALALAIYAPGVVLAAYLLIPFYKGAAQAYSPIDITVVLAVLNGLQIVPVFLNPRRRSISRLGIALWLALPVLVLAGVFYAPNETRAFDEAVRFWILVVLAMFPAALRVGSEQRYVNQFLWSMFGFAVFAVLLAMTQLSQAERLTVLGTGTIGMGRVAMLVPLLVFAFVIPSRPRLIGLFALLLIPPAVIVALAAGSRGPFAAFGLIAGVAGIRYIVARRRAGRSLVPAVAIAAGLVCAVALAVPALPALSVDRFANLAEFVTAGGDVASSGETSGSARLTLYSEALSIFDDYPLLGAGTGGFGEMTRDPLDPSQSHEFPHNAVLQIAAEFGLIGVVCFVSAVLVALGRHFPRRGSLAALKLVFIYFLLNSMVSDDIIADRQTIGLLLLVLAVDLSRVPVAAVGERTIGRIPAALVPAR